MTTVMWFPTLMLGLQQSECKSMQVQVSFLTTSVAQRRAATLAPMCCGHAYGQSRAPPSPAAAVVHQCIDQVLPLPGSQPQRSRCPTVATA